MPAIIVPEGYGQTVLIALGLIPLLSFVQGSVVTSLRKPAKVPYPNHYATAEQVKTSREAYKFNCAQRAHGNLLENMAQVMGMLLFSGLFYPTATPILGLIWVVGRAAFAYGYITSKEQGKGRYMGSFFYIGQFGLMGTSVAAGLKLL